MGRFPQMSNPSPGTSSSSSSTAAIGAFPSPAESRGSNHSYHLGIETGKARRSYGICDDGVGSRTLFGESLGESPQARQAVGSQLVEDAGQHLGQLLGLGVAGDGEGVGGEGGLHFGVVEVDHCALVREHVHLERDAEALPKEAGADGGGGLRVVAPTSSMPEMLLTPSFFSENWSFLSSAVAVLCTTFFFLRALPCGRETGRTHLS